MLYAIGQVGQKVRALPGATATCQGCYSAMLPKCGRIVTWHWAHLANMDGCTTEPETEWHRRWKAPFPVDRAEVRITRGWKTKIADAVAPDGTVIEFQHSPIPVEEIDFREQFYGRMIWVFDASKPFSEGRLSQRRREGYTTFRWKHARKSILSCRRPVFLDLGCFDLFEVRRIYTDGVFAGWGKRWTYDQFKRRYIA